MTQIPRYQQLADMLRQQIDQGILSPGDKLPSVRRFSQTQKVSPGTVLSCYNQLEQLQLIEARPQSGYYVRQPPPTRVKQPDQAVQACDPVEVTMGDLALQVVTATDTATNLPMGPAYPSNEFGLTHQLWRNVARQGRLLAREQAVAPLGYSVPPGEPELIRQLARQYGPLCMAINPEHLLVTNGCQEALSLSLQAVSSSGDIIAVESPVFYGTLQLIESLGLKIVEIPANPDQGISLEALQLALRQWPVKAVLTSANIGNPLGYLMPDEHKQRLLKLLQEYDLPLIEDDVFGDLAYDNTRPLPIKAFDTDDRVLWCSSVSKTVDPGIRIGWLSAGRYHEKVNYLKYVSTMASPAATQQAVAELLTGNSYNRHLRQVRQTYQRRRDQIIAQLQRYLPDECRMTFPKGGFLIWLELPRGIDSLRLHQLALKHQISIAPGILFSATDTYRRCIRLNYACFEEAAFSRGIQQLAELIDQL
ncbi:MAG: PLP-dependent aminotransferase family protein [Amphritea sp.]|nr:PLP-dependent aminotransferase family protein [Amphritea sp.]